MQKKEHKGKKQVLPNCACFTRNVVFFQIQCSGEWFSCHHPSIEPFAAQRSFFVPEIPGIVPEIRGIVPEIPGKQFSHITGYAICFAFLLCTFFPEMSSFCTLCYLFCRKKPLYQKFCDMVFLGTCA